MKLLFTVDITVEVPDAVVAHALGISPALLAAGHTDADLNELAIGQFGDLQLVRGNEPEGYLGNVLHYYTQEIVKTV